MDKVGYKAYLQLLGNQQHYIGRIPELIELEKTLNIDLDDYVPSSIHVRDETVFMHRAGCDHIMVIIVKSVLCMLLCQKRCYVMIMKNYNFQLTVICGIG